MSYETVTRVLRGAGYRIFHSRKNSSVKKEDLKKRRKLPSKVTKLLTDKFWEGSTSFYIDAAEFQHKYNPHDKVRSIRTMTWQLKNEGLHPHCTFKRSHVGSGGRVVYFILATAHQKGVCKQYEGKFNNMFSGFMKTHFQETFSRCKIPKGKRFLQGGGPVQNSKKERQALDIVGAIKIRIPPCSPDFDPIKNIFNYVKSELCTQPFEKNINYETFEKYSGRVKHTLENTPTKYICKTIESMPKRMLMVIKSKG